MCVSYSRHPPSSQPSSEELPSFFPPAPTYLPTYLPTNLKHRLPPLLLPYSSTLPAYAYAGTLLMHALLVAYTPASYLHFTTFGTTTQFSGPSSTYIFGTSPPHLFTHSFSQSVRPPSPYLPTHQPLTF
ncbi:hypothetical protein ONS95_003409 [Cadophora gregata]|uniref:uncharacterized protein n=1 Tax=Cadophora gregata TaxID=51156 RepID=UPI0026DD4F07|nr:uncharacterized protein ONS95_003409 [Cadophora gregata]KAK0108614.1 hypothetical protein ONS95_003409 [Cadophora gregata]